MPAGHELTKIAIAVAISLPANQSVTIFVSWTLSNTPPAPAISRPAICTAPGIRSAMASSPISINTSAPSTVALSPNLLPDRAARQRQRDARREIEADQDADIGKADAEFAAEQRRNRGDALKLERHGERAPTNSTARMPQRLLQRSLLDRVNRHCRRYWRSDCAVAYFRTS